MRKILFVLAAVSFVTLSSCEKDWVCSCSGAEGNINEDYPFRAKEDDAVESCESTEINWQGAYGSDSECKLK